MGRPRKRIDLEKVKELASKGLTQEQIAAWCDCSVDTLSRRCAETLKRGWELRNGSVMQKQYELAMTGNATMLIWLGKQYLGQRDKNEVSGDPERPLITAARPVVHVHFRTPTETPIVVDESPVSDGTSVN
jgi:hypothetical protein